MTPEVKARLLKAFSLKIELPLSLCEWAERYFYLPQTSPIPGRFRSDIAPYQAGALDIISSADYDHVFLVWAAQTGKSTVMLITCTYHMHYDPAPIMVVLPTESTAREFSRLRLESVLKASPALKELFAWTYNNPENTTFWKQFPGGHLSFAWAGSLAQLASKPVRILLLDEIDRFEVTEEGDAFTIAEKRSQAFWNRTVVASSTPTIETTSRIWHFWTISDQYKFFVPCQKCGQYYDLQFQYVKWENDDYETAYIECPHCKAHITEKDRRLMLAEGKWKKITDGKKGYAALHLSALYSPFMPLPNVVREFLEAKQHPEKLRVFVNTILAEPWRDEYQEESFDYADLIKDVDATNCKKFIGVDVQADRIEATVITLQDNDIYVLDHKRFFGDIMQSDVWEQFYSFVLAENASAVFIDSSAFTDVAYSRVSEMRKFTKTVFAIKGIAGPSYKIVHSIKYIDKPRIPLVVVGVDNVKEILYLRLQNKKGLYFASHLADDAEYFLQLTAEKPVIKYSRGQAVREWKRVRKRNEAWDCLVYAYAATFLQQQQTQQVRVVARIV